MFSTTHLVYPFTINGLKRRLILGLCCIFCVLGSKAGQPSISLSQGSNGTDSIPISPVSWVNGNLSASVAHFLETMSVPYQAAMSNMPTGTSITVTIGYPVMSSSKHAFDYLTHYNRLL